METETFWQDVREYAHTKRSERLSTGERARMVLGWMIFSFILLFLSSIGASVILAINVTPWYLLLIVPAVVVMVTASKFMRWYDNKYRIGWW